MIPETVTAERGCAKTLALWTSPLLTHRGGSNVKPCASIPGNIFPCQQGLQPVRARAGPPNAWVGLHFGPSSHHLENVPGGVHDTQTRSLQKGFPFPLPIPYFGVTSYHAHPIPDFKRGKLRRHDSIIQKSATAISDPYDAGCPRPFQSYTGECEMDRVRTQCGKSS